MRLTVGLLSHKRPHLLARVLTALSQQDCPDFEIVVVGDLPALSDYRLPPHLAAGICYLHVAEPNICQSRNRVVAAATGEIVAFCDDDAVPEPDWLRQIAESFSDPRIGAAGGLVRARDGITVEWQGVAFDRSAREHDLEPGRGTRVNPGADQVAQGRFWGLMGANSAFRRGAVIAVGGFDEAYRYFLDETDMALRLAEAGWDIALTDAAEVHHLREINAVRGHLKKPRNLREIAASKAYFCVRHLSSDQIDVELARFRARRLADMDGFLRIGVMREAERDRLVGQVDRGLKEGRGRTPLWPSDSWTGARPWSPWPAAQVSGRLNIAIHCGWGYGHGRRVIAAAERLALAGHRVSVFRFQSGLKARTVVFRNGVWLHEGGTWRLDHRDQGDRIVLRRKRAEAELRRVQPRRRFDVILRPSPSRASGQIVELPGLRPFLLELRNSSLDPDVSKQALVRCFAAPDDPACVSDSQNATYSGLEAAPNHETIKDQNRASAATE